MENLETSRVKVPDSVLMRELAGESVLLNLVSESYFGLDETGTRMWTVLTEAPNVGVAFETLLGEYEVKPEQLRGDLQVFVEKLRQLGLLEIHAG